MKRYRIVYSLFPALKILWSNADANMMLFATLEMRGNLGQVKFAKTSGTVTGAGADPEGGCRGCNPPPPRPRDDLRFSNTTGILEKNYVVYWC